MSKKNLNVLIIDLEYPRSEINEPINIDTILDSFDDFVNCHTTFDIWYRTLGDTEPRDPSLYDLILISTKVGSFKILEQMLENFKGKNVVIGGMLVTFAHKTILQKYPHVILSMGECECNLNSILTFFIEKNDLYYVKQRLISQEISGVSFVDGQQEIYFKTIVPYDLSLITKPLKHRALDETIQKNGLVRIEGSRGCPWNRCSFCCVDWRYGCGDWRAFRIERTITEIKNLVDNGAKTIYFTDEDFVANKQHFFTLFNEIKRMRDENKIDSGVSFWGSTSVYTLNRFGKQGLDAFLSLAKECNIDVLFLGIESGCDEQLQRYSKGVNKEENVNILRRLHKEGIYVDVGFIMFDSETTLSEVRKNLDFCVLVGLDKTISRIAKPIRIIPHTKMYISYEKSGVLTSDLDADELTYSYKFRDHKVQVLFDSLNHLHTVIQDKANELQATIRTTNKYGDLDYVEKLLIQRNYEFELIKKFLDHFSDKEIDQTLLNKLVSDIIQSIAQ